MKNWKIKIMLGASVLSVSGCGLIYAPMPTERGHVLLTGDREGVHALMDGLNGMITNGKATPDHDTSHWAGRRAHEREITKRDIAPGWLTTLFGAKGPTTPSQEEK